MECTNFVKLIVSECEFDLGEWIKMSRTNNVKFWRENGVLMTSAFAWSCRWFRFVDCFFRRKVSKFFVDEKLQKFPFAAFDKRCSSIINANTHSIKANAIFPVLIFHLQSILCAANEMETESILKFKCIGIDASEPDPNINIRLAADIQFDAIHTFTAIEQGHRRRRQRCYCYHLPSFGRESSEPWTFCCVGERHNNHLNGGFLKCTMNQPYSILDVYVNIKLASNIDACYHFNYSSGVVHLRATSMLQCTVAAFSFTRPISQRKQTTQLWTQTEDARKKRVALIIRTKHVGGLNLRLGNTANNAFGDPSNRRQTFGRKCIFVQASISNGNIQQDAQSPHYPYEEQKRGREKGNEKERGGERKRDKKLSTNNKFSNLFIYLCLHSRISVLFFGQFSLSPSHFLCRIRSKRIGFT